MKKQSNQPTNPFKTSSLLTFKWKELAKFYSSILIVLRSISNTGQTEVLIASLSIENFRWQKNTESVDQWLIFVRILRAGHSEAIDIIPEAVLVLQPLLVFNASNKHHGSIWEDLCFLDWEKNYQAIRHQPLVSGGNDSIQHSFVKQKVAHPL